MKRGVLLLVIGFLLVVSPFILQQNGFYKAVITEQSNTVMSYTDSSPIIVENDNELSMLGLPGNGTETNPYIFDDLNITSNLDCITIRNTRAYFEITHCYFAPETDDYSNGIQFENVTNAYVGSNIFAGKTIAIQWDTVNDSQCVNNEISGNLNSGIYLSNCYYCNIEQNQILGDDDHVGIGIQLVGAHYCNATDNEVANGFTGIKVMSSRNCTLYLNDVHNFGYGSLAVMGNPSGIEVTGCPNTSIVENSIYNSPNAGILIANPDSVYCWYNVLTDCGFLTMGLIPGIQGFTSTGDLVNSKPMLYLWNQTNLVVDGSPYAQIILHESKFCTITGGAFNEASMGIMLTYSTNCTIRDAESSGNYFTGALQYLSTNCTYHNLTLNNNGRMNDLTAYKASLYLYNSQNTRITNCRITESPAIGLFIAASPGAVLRNNVFLRSGIYVVGMGIPTASDFYLVQDNNTINGKSFGYFYNETNLAVDGSLYGQILVVNSSRVDISGGNFDAATAGVVMVLTDNCTLSDATTEQNSIVGLQIVSSTNMTISRTSISENPYGAAIAQYSESTKYLNNTIHGNGYAIPENQNTPTLLAGAYDELSNNEITHNRFGVQLLGTNIIVCKNNISCNGMFGVYVSNGDHFNISSNRILGNFLEPVTSATVSGIYVSSGIHGVIHNNSIFSNSGYGVMMGSLSAIENSVYWNEIGWNGLGNAADGGLDNLWNDNVTTGNAWSDYVGPGVYPIMLSSSVDRFPISLIDSTTPIIDHPEDEAFEAGLTESILEWHASDNYPGKYLVFQNGSVIANRTWHQTIELEIGPLSVGLHNLTIIVYDGAGNFATDTVYINSTDTISPLVDSPPDISYDLGQTGFIIEWHGTDLNPAAYEIHRNLVVIKSGLWNTSEETISFGVDELTVTSTTLYESNFFFRIVLIDQGGNSVRDVVMVTVARTTTTTNAHEERTVPNNLPEIITIYLVAAAIGVIFVVILWKIKD